MVRPACFGFNVDAAQHQSVPVRPERSGRRGPGGPLAEFAALRTGLEGEGVQVCVAADTPDPPKPDAVFPNNWVSFHADGTLVLYPLQPRAAARTARGDRRAGLPRSRLRAAPPHRLDAARARRTLPRGHGEPWCSTRVAPRLRLPLAAHRPALLHEWCALLDYEPVAFRATDAGGVPWYHTNVMMCLGTGFALLAAESIAPPDRERVLASLADSGRELIAIDRAAVAAFAGNMLELAASDEALGDVRVLVMSERARRALDGATWQRLSATVDSVLAVPVPTIERVGGGGVRCMIAEVGVG